MEKKEIKIITTLEKVEQWPEYLEEMAGYYHRKKLKQDMLGAAEIIRQLLKEAELSRVIP